MPLILDIKFLNFNIMSSSKLIFVGLIISSNSLKNLRILNGFLAVEDGKITKLGNTSEYETTYSPETLKQFKVIQLKEGQFLMPGFIDCHTHAPQFPNIGIGLDRPLLAWLEKYTFPLEKQYSDREFASKIYDKVVNTTDQIKSNPYTEYFEFLSEDASIFRLKLQLRLLKNGTTTACYFGSLSLPGTMELVHSVLRHGQRALAGKVSMNAENGAGYYNDTKTEVTEVNSFVQQVLELKSDLVEPIITPRFAVSCDEELMTNLSAIAMKYNCRIQSHISENASEIQYVLDNFPKAKSYTEVYDQSKILTNKCIMAHAVHLSEEEMNTLAQRGVSIAHCPASNTRLMSGLCPIRKILDHGINAGLGTDVSGGDSATILDAMRRAMDVSAHLQIVGESTAAISWREAFYLATLGGAKALNLDHKVGNFEVGKEFDALLVNVFVSGGPIDKYEYSVDTTEEEVAENLLQQFIYLADDRNIEHVYVKGVRTK